MFAANSHQIIARPQGRMIIIGLFLGTAANGQDF